MCFHPVDKHRRIGKFPGPSFSQKLNMELWISRAVAYFVSRTLRCYKQGSLDLIICYFDFANNSVHVTLPSPKKGKKSEIVRIASILIRSGFSEAQYNRKMNDVYKR